jgi:hypothetical protein
MAVKPLAKLLKEADEFDRKSSQTKLASSQAAAVKSDIEKLALELVGAAGVDQWDKGFEKTAMALNRAEALLQIRTLQKIAAFRTKALSEGFTEVQVEEAVEKIAAKKLKENLKVLTAVDGIADPSPDKNSLVKKKVPARELGQPSADLTTTMGYGT